MSQSPPVLVPSRLWQLESSSTPSLSEGSSDGPADSLQKSSTSGVHLFPTWDVISKPCAVFDSTCNHGVACPVVKLPCPKSCYMAEAHPT